MKLTLIALLLSSFAVSCNHGQPVTIKQPDTNVTSVVGHNTGGGAVSWEKSPDTVWLNDSIYVAYDTIHKVDTIYWIADHSKIPSK